MFQASVLAAALLLLLLFSRRHRLPLGSPGKADGEFTNVAMPEVFEKWKRKYGEQANGQGCPNIGLIMCVGSDILIQARDGDCHRYG